MSTRHRLLARQLRKAFGERGPPPELDALLALVDDAYRRADDDRRLLERSLELTSDELQDRTERLRSFFDGAPFAMGTARLAGDDLVIESASARARQLLGGAPSSAVERVTTALPDEARRAWLEGASRALGSEGPVRIDYVVPDELETRSYVVTFAKLRSWSEVDAVSYLVEDTTERTQLFDQLVQRDRLATVGALAAGVAHEINNPLTYVVSNVEVAREILRASLSAHVDPAALAEAAAALDDARIGSERVHAIVRELRTFSGTPHDEANGRVTVESVIAFATRVAAVDLRRRARLLVDVADVPPVVGDETRLGQVFLNLVVNAIGAIPEGDPNDHRIELRGGRDELGRPFVDVSDTGSGMTPSVAARVFDPFFTTRKRGVGTGLGLAIVKAILIRSGGDVEVRTTAPGRGTTFRVRLAEWTRAREVVEPTPALPRPTRRGARVLVVDDDVMVARAIARMLGADHDVVVVNGGPAALELLARDRHFDLVLCDLHMPECDGVQVYQRGVRGTSLRAAFHFVTADGSDATFRELCARDHVDVLEKPCAPGVLRRLAHDAAARARADEPEASGVRRSRAG